MGKVIRVMVVDSTGGAVEMLSELIDSQEDMETVARATDGVTALELARRERPDVLITDLILRGLDGLGLMRALREAGELPHTIVLSGFANDHLAERAGELGADYFLLKPFRMDALTECIRDCAEGRGGIESRMRMETKAVELLGAFGIQLHHSGYDYLKRAMVLQYGGNIPLRGVTKILYPELAKQFHTTPEGVERCIRHAIVQAWDHGKAHERTQAFAGLFEPGEKAPTNSCFLAAMNRLMNAELLRGEKLSL